MGVIVVAAGILAVCGLTFYKQAQSVKDHENQAVSAISAMANSDVLKSTGISPDTIAQAQRHTAEAKRIAHGSLWNIFSVTPVVGNDVKTLQGMTEVLDDLTQQTLPEINTIAQKFDATQLEGGNGNLNLKPICDIQSDFASLSTQLKQQQNKYDSLPKPKIGMISKAYQQGGERLASITDTVSHLNSAMQMMPAILGQNGARTYLIAVQTTSEQRSGGGLVGSLGTLHTDQGTISVGDFHADKEFLNGSNGNNEELSVFNGPLRFSLDVRDTFAIPDLSRNAEMLTATWQRSPYASDVDGFIAIDPVFIQKMVEISGNVTLQDGTVLTGKNTAEYLLNTIYKDVPVAQQDAYFEYIAQTAMNQAFGNLNATKMMAIANSIGSMIAERHFYAYTTHADETTYFQDAGISSREDTPQIGIYLNEQNPSKMGWYIKRKAEVSKTGTNKDGSKTYHVRYTLTNTLTAEEKASVNNYILGGVQKGVENKPVAASGTSVQRMLFYAPASGSIGKISSKGDVRDQREATMDGKQLTTNVAYLAPGKSVIFEFDVITSPKATSELTIDQTPCGEEHNEVDYRY
ncbi:DUF4012 domain-containing protein [Bifidobacterium pongonis]|uniref:DUF4012 domain-containing protein n=1 Tax=Bifidobacterium pongonis TaxID=2834432 RepID=UPI001F382B2F|nr:DUF4012 domain-containing protein [Bifidobacterium pongonis]